MEEVTREEEGNKINLSYHFGEGEPSLGGNK